VIRPARATNLPPRAANQAADHAAGAEPFRSTRREPRSSTELTFAVCGLAFNGRFFVELCSTVNISRSGCRLRLLFQLAWMRPDDGGWLIGAFALGEADLYRLAFPSYTP